MKVALKTNHGITNIYLPTDPPPQTIKCKIPKKKPYLIFQFRFSFSSHDILSTKNGNTFNFFDHLDHSTKECLRKLNKFGYNELEPIDIFKEDLSNKNHNIITHAFIRVSGNNNVIKAIQTFTSLKEYQNLNNQALFEILQNDQKQCETNRMKNKKHYSRPSKSKLFNRYIAKTGETPLRFSNYQTHVVVRVDDPSKEYIFKENTRSSADLEAFNGFCFDLLLGNQHPKIRTVYDDQGNRLGTLSRRIPNFSSFADEFFSTRKSQHLTLNDVIHTEMVKIWVAAFVEEENDLHEDNFGFSLNLTSGKRSRAYKIDDDCATWSLSSKYRYDPEEKQFAFPITQKDIANFPTLTYAHPNNWPTYSPLLHSALLEELKKHQKFIDDKYLMFLKRILIPAETYAALGQATIRSDKLRAKAIRNKQAKTEELKKVLLGMPEFQRYIETHPDLLINLKREFEEYNQKSHKPEDTTLRIDLNQIEKNYHEIKKIVSRTFVPEKINAPTFSNLIIPQHLFSNSQNVSPCDNRKMEIDIEENDYYNPLAY